MSMGRPRKPGNKDLGEGLYRDPRSGVFYVRHPVTKKNASLRTKDAARARKLHNMLRATWESEVDRHRAELMARKLRGVGLDSDRTLAEYAADWRVRRLPRLLKKNGKPLGESTRKDYDGMIRRDVETWEPFAKLLIGEVDETHLRKFLARWIDSPSAYNYMLAALTRLFRDAVDEALIARNPIKFVDRRGVPKREVYITDDQYLEIIAQVEAGAGYDEDAEHEWVARAVDLVYLVSHNPQDVLAIKESSITAYGQEKDGAYGELLVTRGKTGQQVLIYANKDLWDIIGWFRDWKRQQRLMSEYLVCYPRKGTRRSFIGQRVSVEFVSRRFTAAARAAGHGGITLRDLRSKGLSDEFVIAGDSDKGGHKTQQMKEHYRRVKLPMRARSNLRRLTR